MVLHRLPQFLPRLGSFVARRTIATALQNKLTLPRLPLFEALNSHPKSKTAIVHSKSKISFTYGNLLADTALYKDRLLRLCEAGKEQDINEKRVAFLFQNNYDYVVSMLSIFASGGIAVPLCTSHPTPEMRYVVSDCTPSLLLTSNEYIHKVNEIFDSPDLQHACEIDVVARHPQREAGATDTEVELVDPAWANKYANRGALIIYTSGTTNLPKGVVSTNASLIAQSTSLVKAWEMSESDYLLHVLPLHHVHGVVNATLAPLLAGGTVEYLFPFNPRNVWNRLAAKGKDKKGVTLFMAVPTIYNRLLSTFSALPKKTRKAGREAVRSLRLAISGSAALPGSIKDQWRKLAGTNQGGGTMLERYGMTEVGMALSQRLPLSDRMPNSIGWPLPGVEARLVDIETGVPIPPEKTEKEGEIQIRGPTVFREYWQKPKATQKEFVDGGDGGNWFKTGDVAVRDERGAYYIHGRASVDIIKSGGEKVSALEVERELLELPEISEAAVVALPDPDWGQRVAAIIVLSEQGKKECFGYEEMRKVMKERLASYKVPTVMKVVKALKRNQMGKINKKALVSEEFK